MYEQYGITLSTVGIGKDAAPFLEELAKLGGGRYHFTDNPAAIPSIFTEETTLATRAYIVEEFFYPQLVARSSILTGIDSLPPLYGYVGTEAKNTAQTILTSARGDPILAAWQYGLGKTVAFTSDATGRWGLAWVNWEQFPAFWGQAVAYTISERPKTALELSVEQIGENTQLLVNATAPNGTFLNNYTLRANIVAPDGSAQSIDLRQIAPGQYTANFIPHEQGAYLIRTIGSSPTAGQPVLSETAGWVLSYSPEYRNLESDPDALYRLQATSQGFSTRLQDPAAAFAHTLQAPRAAQPAWPWLLCLAVLLLPFDIAVRRLAFTRHDLRTAWRRALDHLPKRRPTPAAIPAGSSAIGNLLQIKGRTHPSPKTQQSSVSPTTLAPSSANEQPRAPQEKTAVKSQGAPSPVVPTQIKTTGSQSTKTPPESTAPETSTAAKLLAHKHAQYDGKMPNQDQKQ
jgi:hypothetical protein